MGMLSYFVHVSTSQNVLTPNYVVILFIVSVLGLVWALFTLFSYHRSSANARFVGLVDLGFLGAFIAGVYYLRFITRADCTNIVPGSTWDVDFGIFGSAHLTGFQITANKTCAMLKACFAFGIMNCIFFACTAVLAWFHGDHAEKERVRRDSSRRRSGSVHHHHHRHRSGSRHGSHRSSRSHSHSHSRTYV